MLEYSNLKLPLFFIGLMRNRLSESQNTVALLKVGFERCMYLWLGSYYVTRYYQNSDKHAYLILFIPNQLCT